MAGKASIDTLTKILQKSGLPLGGDSYGMEKASLGAEDQIRGAVDSESQLAPYEKSYRDQLAQVAAMDQKLQGVYADPNSPLFIEHAGQREGIYSGAQNRGYNAARGIASAEKAKASEIEGTVNDAMSLFTKLTSLQKKEEAFLKKQRGGGKKSKNAAAEEKWRLAGLVDQDAIDLFEKAPTKFQEQWTREYQTAKSGGDAGEPEDQYYTADDIRSAWSIWDQKNETPRQRASREKAATKGSDSEKAAQLKKSLGL